MDLVIHNKWGQYYFISKVSTTAFAKQVLLHQQYKYYFISHYSCNNNYYGYRKHV